MARFAILNATNVVLNLVEADASWRPGTGLTTRDAGEAQIGGRWTGTEWEAPPAQPVPVPAAITPLQARRALRAAGMLAGVNAYLATRSEGEREAWEYCIEVQRDDAMITQAAAALGVSSAQMDDLFRAGALIV